jgi:hypothetical protein
MIQPSLQIGGGDWAVKETKLLGTNPLLNEKLPVEIDVTNATIGTRVNKEGIIENGPRNLLTFSEDFNNAAWQKQGSTATIPIVTANSIIAPNGTLTAELVEYSLVPDGDFCALTANVTNVSESTTVSIYAKAFDSSQVGKKISIIGNGTLGVSGSVGTLTLDWQRFTYIKPGKNNQIIIGKGRSTYLSGGITNAEMATKFYIWGAQLEEGSTATEYYPTTTRTNLARIDYSSGEAALLLEPQRTNLALNSKTFDNWTKINAVVSINNAIAPDGTMTAAKLTATVGSGHSEHKIISLLTTADSVSAIYAKKAEERYLNIRRNSNLTWGNVIFDLELGTLVLNSNPTNAIPKITNVGNGWYRCEVAHKELGQSEVGFGISRGTTDAYASSNTTDGILIWGAQVEIGSYATSYIPTLASAVTRNADVITKTEISNLINSQEGVLFVESEYTRAGPGSSARKLISINDGTSTNLIDIFIPSGQNTLFVRVRASSQQFGAMTTSNVPLGKIKVAYSYKSNNYSLYINGTLIEKVTTGGNFIFSSALNILQVGDGEATGDELGGRINQLHIYKTVLTDAQLITLTTI